jgi:hypothetical protein
MSRGLLVHIGLPKTGTTSLQMFLSTNKSNLADNSQIMYRPESNEISHNGLCEAVRAQDASTIQSMVFGQSPDVDSKLTVVSSENLHDLSREEIVYFLEVLGVIDVELMIGVRNPGSLLLAWWKERAKAGLQGDFPNFLDTAIDNKMFFIGPILDNWKGLLKGIHIYFSDEEDLIPWFLNRFTKLSSFESLENRNLKLNSSMGLIESILTSKASNGILTKDFLVDGNHAAYSLEVAKVHLYGLIDWVRPMYEYSKSFTEYELVQQGVLESSLFLGEYSNTWCDDFLESLKVHSNIFGFQADAVAEVVLKFKEHAANSRHLIPTVVAEERIRTSSTYYALVRLLESALASSLGLTYRSNPINRDRTI